MKVLRSQEEMRSEVFRALRPSGVVTIHWGHEWCLESPSGRRGVVRVRAVFKDRAPSDVRSELRNVVHVVDTQPIRYGAECIEFEIMYPRN